MLLINPILWVFFSFPIAMAMEWSFGPQLRLSFCFPATATNWDIFHDVLATASQRLGSSFVITIFVVIGMLWLCAILRLFCIRRRPPYRGWLVYEALLRACSFILLCMIFIFIVLGIVDLTQSNMVFSSEPGDTSRRPTLRSLRYRCLGRL